MINRELEWAQTVFVRSRGDGSYSVWVGDDLRLITLDEDAAFQTGRAAACEEPFPGRTMLVSSGPDTRRTVGCLMEGHLQLRLEASQGAYLARLPESALRRYLPVAVAQELTVETGFEVHSGRKACTPPPITATATMTVISSTTSKYPCQDLGCQPNPTCFGSNHSATVSRHVLLRRMKGSLFSCLATSISGIACSASSGRFGSGADKLTYQGRRRSRVVSPLPGQAALVASAQTAWACARRMR